MDFNAFFTAMKTAVPAAAENWEHTPQSAKFGNLELKLIITDSFFLIGK